MQRLAMACCHATDELSRSQLTPKRLFISNVPFFVTSLLAAVLATNPVRAAITMSTTYYTIAETDQDMNHLAAGVFNNEVQSALGPHGLPILNTTTYGCTSNCFTATPLPQDLTSSGEITWWSPSLNNGGTGGTSDVVQTGTGTISLPYNNPTFFPPNGTGSNNANGFQSAVFSTTLNVPTTESISFNIGADDDAFVYLDGTIVCDLGGVHADSPGTCTSTTLTAGDHTLELFYADIHQTEAALTFNVTTQGVNSVPAPAPLIGHGFLALFAVGGVLFAGKLLERSKKLGCQFG
jgi:fibro-slime domain-containing protein